MGWVEKLLEISLVFIIVAELLIMSEVSIDTFVFEIIETVRRKETIL